MPAYHVYGNFLVKVITGNIDVDTDNFRAMLVTAAYTPDLDAHDFLNDASGSEIAGTNYTASGKALTGVTVTKDNASNEVRVDWDDLTWTSLDVTSAGARYLIISKDRGGADSADELVCYLDLDSDRDPGGNNLVITQPATGPFKFTYA
jgi:hypothetical protein